MLASRVAHERSIELGKEIGYQTRFDACHSNQTRIVFITAGILPRYFLSNPTLNGVSAVVIDEFHERSLNNDLSLGLIKHLQDQTRGDLKLIVMSATLDVTVLQDYLPGNIYLTSKSRNFPVDLSYVSPRKPGHVWEDAAVALNQLIQSHPTGDILIFMPGVYEVQKTIRSCKKLKTREKINYFPLYGDLPPEQQEAVMHGTSLRKVVVATNIAEASLTIPGIRYVIDSGLARQNRYDPNRGLNTLFIEPISKDSADQRAGRAGREGPGKCIRLWPAQAHERKSQRTDPEIKRIDLAETILHLMVHGFGDLRQFPWLEPPAQRLIDKALTSLVRLDALIPNNLSLTELGNKMAGVPAHPRIARLLIEAKERHCQQIAAMIAAIMSDRSILLNDKPSKKVFLSHFPPTLDLHWTFGIKSLNGESVEGPGNTLRKNSFDNKQHEARKSIKSDVYAIVNALIFARQHNFERDACQSVGIHGAASRQVWRTFTYFISLMDVKGVVGGCRDVPDDSIAKCLLLAYSDRLAKRRDSGSLIYLLEDGRKAELTRHSSAKCYDLIIATDLVDLGSAGRNKPALISLACGVKRAWLDELFPQFIRTADTHTWNDTKRLVERYQVSYFNTLVIEKKNCSELNQPLASQILAASIRKQNLPLKGWDKSVKNWIQRVQCVAQWFPERGIASYDDKMMEAIFMSVCANSRRYLDVKNKPCIEHVKSQLSVQEQKFVESMAPERIALSNGVQMRIKYSPGRSPMGNAKIQDLFGVRETPRIADGKQKVLIEILAPNFRPIQVTDDLRAFWKNLYPAVKQELARRYPSHEWR